MLYPRVVWEPIRAKLMALPALDKRSAKVQRRLVGHAESVSLDSAGRMLVPPLLRETVGLEKEVVLVGLESHFELWDKEAWMRECQNDGDDVDLSPEMQGITL